MNFKKLMKREDRIRRERFLKDLEKSQRIAKIKEEIRKDFASRKQVYVKSEYPKDTDISKLAKEFVNEYKLAQERKKAVKLTLIDHEEWLKRKTR